MLKRLLEVKTELNATLAEESRMGEYIEPGEEEVILNVLSLLKNFYKITEEMSFER